MRSRCRQNGATLITVVAVVGSLLRSAVGSPLDVKISAEVISDLELMPMPLAPPPCVHNVSVGLVGDRIFSPRYIRADVGDIVRFRFADGNHTVTESTFLAPCSPRGAFDTNFFYASNEPQEEDTMTILVDTSNPRWFFCKQTFPSSHCHSGMVFAINPGTHWIEFAARARSYNSSTVARTGTLRGLSEPTLETGYGGAKSATAVHPVSTYTVKYNLTSVETTVTRTVDHHLNWSTQTITSLITTTFSFSR